MNFLFNGCSFTADSGFIPVNQPLYHWPHLLCQHFGANMNNIAIGGSSNEEIFYRQLQESQNQNYDLVIIMWSGFWRKWVYHSTNNVDDWTIITPGQIKGFNCDHSHVHQYSKLHYQYFSNEYVGIRNWLLQLIALTEFFTSKKQQYVYLLGMNNCFRLLESARLIPKQGFVDMHEWCKKILDFDNRPDDYIATKLESLQSLVNTVKSFNWLDWNDQSFRDQAVDLADDHVHPGILSNQALSHKMIPYIETILQRSNSCPTGASTI